MEPTNTANWVFKYYTDNSGEIAPGVYDKLSSKTINIVAPSLLLEHSSSAQNILNSFFETFFTNIFSVLRNELDDKVTITFIPE